MSRVIDEALDRQHLLDLIEERALGHDVLDKTKVQAIREQMERAQARRLQPHYIRSFFLAAFQRLGGRIQERETRRYEISRVPAVVRQRDRQIGTGAPVLNAYERIVFEKELIALRDKPLAEFVCPGHPLLDATIDVLLEQNRDLLRRGTVLVDGQDPGDQIRMLCFLEHSIQDARPNKDGSRRLVSRRLEFVELAEKGNARSAGYAPYLDYSPIDPEDRKGLEPSLSASWLRAGVEESAIAYAIEHVSRQHLEEVRTRTEARVQKTMEAVKERLTREINYWDHRAEELKAQELAGKTPKLNSARARQRADELADRLQKRMLELEQERKLSPLPPIVVGGSVVIPAGLVAKLKGEAASPPDLSKRETKRVELLAMAAVLQAETRAGHRPRDVSNENLGYDIESKDDQRGRLRFIEVKGRVKDAMTVTVTRNEVLTCLNKPEDFYLAVVEVDGQIVDEPRYLLAPFRTEPDFAATSVTYSLPKLFGGVGAKA